MGIVLSEQCLCFLASVIAGFLFGLCYELLRVFRVALPHNAFVIGLEDFFFCITCAFGTILLCYLYADGVIRWFAVGGILLGAFLYFYSLGKGIQKITPIVITRIKSAIRRTLHILAQPLLLLMRATKRQIKKAVRTFEERRKARIHKKIQRRILRKLTHF